MPVSLLSPSVALAACALAVASPPPPPPPVHAESPASATDVLHADLANAAPTSPWQFTPGGMPEGPYDDTVDKKIKRSAGMVVAGTLITVGGLVGGVGGVIMLTTNQPSAKLPELENANGAIPAGDPKRRRIIAMNQAAPFVIGASTGLMIGGLAVAYLGVRRIKKLRALKAKGLALSIEPGRGSLRLGLGGRF